MKIALEVTGEAILVAIGVGCMFLLAVGLVG